MYTFQLLQGSSNIRTDGLNILNRRRLTHRSTKWLSLCSQLWRQWHLCTCISQLSYQSAQLNQMLQNSLTFCRSQKLESHDARILSYCMNELCSSLLSACPCHEHSKAVALKSADCEGTGCECTWNFFAKNVACPCTTHHHRLSGALSTGAVANLVKQ